MYLAVLPSLSNIKVPSIIEWLPDSKLTYFKSSSDKLTIISTFLSSKSEISVLLFAFILNSTLYKILSKLLTILSSSDISLPGPFKLSNGPVPVLIDTIFALFIVTILANSSAFT